MSEPLNIELTEEDKTYIEKFKKRQVLPLPITRSKISLIRSIVNGWEREAQEKLRESKFPTIPQPINPNSEIQMELITVKQELDNTKRQLDVATKSYEKLLTENITLQKQPTINIDKFDELKEKYINLKEKIEDNDTLKKEIETLKILNKGLLSDIEKLKRPFTKSNSNEELFNENENLIEQIQELKSKINDNFLELQDLKKKNREKDDIIKQLKFDSSFEVLEKESSEPETSFSDDLNKINPHV